MTVGALLDAGLPLSNLQEAYRVLELKNLAVSAEPVVRSGIRATQFCIHVGEQRGHRHFSQIRKMIESSSLSQRAKELTQSIFGRLAEAEAEVHGTPVEKVHFHEVGAVDSIADIVGAAVGFEYFKVDRFFTSPINVGHGTVSCEHGVLPVPPPATALLLRTFETFSGTVQSEMTTPTGAAIVATLAKPVPPSLPVRKEMIGYGAGARDFSETPNVLRIFLAPETASLPGEREVIELQANIDDMNPQLYGLLLQRLLASGALEVFFHPVTMKQGRPGVLLTVLCESPRREKLISILFRETTTLGVRYQLKQREILDRSFVSVETPYGSVRIKVAGSGKDVFNYAPEFEDCQRLAESAGIPVKEVYSAAMAAYWNTRHKETS